MKNNYIKLPIIKELEVKGYKLFKSDWKYEFKSGLNLFVGGNRLGKTTTVYIILYGLVGLPKDNKDFFLERVAYKKKEENMNAIVKLKFAIGNNSITIERNLFNSQINCFSINNKIYEKENTENIDQLYMDNIVELAGISSLEDYRFLPEKLLFREEEGNYLLWDPESQMRVLRLLFNYGKFDEEFRKLEEEVRKFDTDVRGQQDIQAQFRKRLEAIKEQKYDKIVNVEKVDPQVLSKNLNELEKNKTALSLSYEKMLEEIKNTEEKKKQLIQILSGLSNDIEELDSEIINMENILFESIYTDPKIQLADSKLKHYNICIFCNRKISNKKAQEIVVKIENNKICPVCNNVFDRKIHKKIDKKTKRELMGNLIEKREAAKNKKDEFSKIQKELNDFEVKFKRFWEEKERIERDLEEDILKIDDMKIELSQYESGKMEKITVYDRDIKALKDQIDYYQTLIDEAKTKRQESLGNLEKKNGEFNQRIQKISNNLVGIFKEYINGFFDECDLVVKERKPKGSMINLNVFVPKFDGYEKTFFSQVSKSEAIFLEYVFRISLCELFKQITGNKSLLVIETSEGAFDIGNVRILAASISKYYSSGSDLLIISNLGRPDFIELLIKKTKKDISKRILNYLKIGRLSMEQMKDRKEFDGILKKIF